MSHMHYFLRFAKKHLAPRVRGRLPLFTDLPRRGVLGNSEA